VFTNVFDPTVNIQEVYDLKGSSVGRQVLVPNRLILRRAASVLKDLDFTRSLYMINPHRANMLQ
jgi:hypothetical protein